MGKDPEHPDDWPRSVRSFLPEDQPTLYPEFIASFLDMFLLKLHAPGVSRNHAPYIQLQSLLPVGITYSKPLHTCSILCQVTDFSDGIHL